MTGNAGSDFRIKLLVVHPDGRRQKFLVTFPERRTLKIDQRYIGLPLTLRVDFIPGAIVCRPGTGHSLSVAGKAVKEHSLVVNDVVGLDQYSIEFLELPEPLPMEEATRFVSINDISEATVVVASPANDGMDVTPLPVNVSSATPLPPQRPHAPAAHTPKPQPAPQQPANNYQPQMYRPDAEDSTAVIRRLQVPGTAPTGNNHHANYANLQANRTDMMGLTASGVHTSPGTEPGFGGETATGAQTQPGSRFGKKHFMGAGAAIIAVLAYMMLGHGGAKNESKQETEKSSQAEMASQSPEENSGEMKPMELPETDPTLAAGDAAPMADMPSAAPMIPAPQAVVPAPVPMAANGSPTDSPFDDKTGFDPMAVDSFFDAVDSGDEAKIKELIEKRLVDVNLSRRRGYAALHLAASRGDLATVKYLVKLKADPNVLDGSGATPLMWSVFRRHEDVVKFLAGKTDLKIVRQGGETAYDLAKRMKMTRILKSLDPDPKKLAAKSKAPAKKRIPTSLPKKK